MTDDEDFELGNIEFTISQVRADYFRHRDHLRLLMKDVEAPGVDAAEALLAIADEFGPETAMTRLAQDRETFGLGPQTLLDDAKVRDRVADVLSEANDANYELGFLISAREQILCDRDPLRERVYNFDGREVFFDVQNEVVRYVDEPQEVAPLHIEAVDPAHEPTRELLKQLQRERERHRDRQR